MLCVLILLISGGRELQFKVVSEWPIFWETFHGYFIYSQSFYQKSAEMLEPWLFVLLANTLHTRPRRLKFPKL